MPEQILGDFDVDAALPEQICHAVAERVPADLLFDTQPLKHRPNAAPTFKSNPPPSECTP